MTIAVVPSSSTQVTIVSGDRVTQMTLGTPGVDGRDAAKVLADGGIISDDTPEALVSKLQEPAVAAGEQALQIANDAAAQTIATANALKVSAWTVDRIFYLLAMGQSNEVGAGGARGDMTILPGVKIWNGLVGTSTTAGTNAGTAFVAPQFGVAPVGGDNNHYIHTANTIMRSGRVDEVRITLVALGGDTITHFTRHHYPDSLGASGFDIRWQELVAQLAASGIPRIDGVEWDQGQRESTTEMTLDPPIYVKPDGTHVAPVIPISTPDPSWTLLYAGSPNTADLYLRELGLPNIKGTVQTPPDGCTPLLTRLRALPQWQTWTAFVAVEMGSWFEAASTRNDAVRQLVSISDPQVSCIGSYGTFMSADAGDADHFDGSCAPMLGARLAGEIMSIGLGRGKGMFAPRANNGGRQAPAVDLGSFVGVTYNVSILDLLNGCRVALAWSTLNLPLASYVPGGSIAIYVTSVSSGTSTIANAQSIDFGGGSATTAVLDTVGVYFFKVINGRWRQVADPAMGSGFKRGGILAGGTTLTVQQCKGQAFQCSGTITLPAANSVQRGVVRIIADQGADVTLAIAAGGGSFFLQDGSVPLGSLTVTAGSWVDVQPDAAARWRVSSSSVDMLGAVTGLKKAAAALVSGTTLTTTQCQGWAFEAAGSIILPAANGVGRGHLRLIADQGADIAVTITSAGSFIDLDGATVTTITIPAGAWADFEPDANARWRLFASSFGMLARLSGLKRGGAVIAAGTTLTAAQCQGGALECAGSVILPAANTVARGRLRLTADQGADVLVTVVSTGGIRLGDGSETFSGFAIPAGGFVDLEPDLNARWRIVGGMVNVGMALGGKVLQRLPVTQQVTTADATQTVAFANAILPSEIGTAEYTIYAETQDATGNSGMAAVRIRYARSASATARTFEIVTTSAFAGDGALAGCAVTGAISGNNLQIKVTGLAGKSIKWTVMERRTEKAAEYV